MSSLGLPTNINTLWSCRCQWSWSWWQHICHHKLQKSMHWVCDWLSTNKLWHTEYFMCIFFKLHMHFLYSTAGTEAEHEKYHPEEGNCWSAQSRKQVSQCIHKISKCHWTLENEHRKPIINTFHAPTKVNGCTKYEQDLLNIVGCRVVMRAGRTDGQTDGWMDGQTKQGTTVPYGLNGPRVIKLTTDTSYLSLTDKSIVQILENINQMTMTPCTVSYLHSDYHEWWWMSSYQYGKSHCGDKTVVRSSYLDNGISYTGKMSSLYWISPLMSSQCSTSPILLNSRIYRQSCMFQHQNPRPLYTMKTLPYW